METQKKYHDLVFLDESNATKQFVMKKMLFILLLFLFGIIVGAFLISFLHNKNKLTTQATWTIEPLPKTNVTDFLPEIVSSSDLQGITAITARSSKTEGCSVESLGRNLTEGCAVDDYAERPIDEKPDNTAIGITPLDVLISPKNHINDADSPVTEENAVTNILDLQ